MAFVTTETLVVREGGSSPARMHVYGTYLNSAGGTGGIIAAGYTNSSGSLTATTSGGLGGRKILTCVLTPTLSDVTAPGGAITYNTTIDSDIFTCVTTVDTGGTYKLECLDNGN